MCSPPDHSKKYKNRTASAKLRLLWTAVHEEEAEAEKESQQRQTKMDRPVLKTFPSQPPLCNDLRHSQTGNARASCSTAAPMFYAAVDTPLRCSPDPSNCTARNIDTPPTVHRTLYSRRAASSESVQENAHEGGDDCVFLAIGYCDSTSTPSPAAADAVSEQRLPASAENACPTTQPEVPSTATSPFRTCSGASVYNMAAHRPTQKHQEEGGRERSDEEVSSAQLAAEALPTPVSKEEREVMHSVQATKKMQDEATGDAKVAERTIEVLSAPPPPPPPPPAKERHADLGEVGAAGVGQIPLRRLHWDKIGIHNAQRTIWQSDAMRHATNRVASK